MGAVRAGPPPHLAAICDAGSFTAFRPMMFADCSQCVWIVKTYWPLAHDHAFDVCYYPCLDTTRGRPFGLYLHGNEGTEGPRRASPPSRPAWGGSKPLSTSWCRASQAKTTWNRVGTWRVGRRSADGMSADYRQRDGGGRDDEWVCSCARDRPSDGRAHMAISVTHS